MTWIKTIPYAEATGRLKTLYDRIKGPDGQVDNIMAAHGLRPHSMEGHMALYKYVLHHTGNRLPRWFMEAVGAYVSALNGCAYCVQHHLAGMRREMEPTSSVGAIEEALTTDAPEDAFTGKELAALRYAKALTADPATMTESSVIALREAGYDDGEILELNQICAYFAYANRTVLGLGVTTAGEVLGLSPNAADDPEDWGHR